MGRGPKPAKSKEAKLPVPRKSPKDDGAKARDLETRLAETQEQLQTQSRELVEARGQLTATAEILQLVSRARTDVQSVFDAIADSAVRLCQADIGGLFRIEDGQLYEVSTRSRLGSEIEEMLRRIYPRPVDTSTFIGRAIVERRVFQVADMADPATPQSATTFQRLDFRSQINVPMLRGGEPIGGISLVRRRPGLFSDDQIQLLKTFADQAAIAIENARVFKELQEKNQAITEAHAQVSEALEQQTATAEILRVISSSPTDLQLVMDAVAENAARVCGATDATIRLIEGDIMRVASRFGAISPVAPEVIPVDRDSHSGRAIVERRTIHIEDIRRLPETEFPRIMRENQRTVLATPLMRKGEPIGAILIRRVEVHPFTDKQIELLQTFADQAVIAIENVRLFTELEARNRDLTATSAILQVISSSPTDVRPIFDAIVDSAATLCDAVFSALGTFDGELMDIVAAHNWTPAAWDVARRTWPAPPSRALVTGRAILERAVVHVPDVELDREYGSPMSRTVGARSMLAVPMLRDGVPLGVIGVGRAEPGPFSASQIALLKTFADQAVIAIENVRLFTELQEKNKALTAAHSQVTESLEQQTATSDVLRVISSSPTDAQPVFDSIAASALRLCDARLCTVFRFDGELIHLVALQQVSTEGAAAYRSAYPARPGRGGGTHRAILTGTIVHIPDIRDDPEYELQDLARANRFGCVLSVPMFRDGHPIGAITVGREAAQSFADAQIELLKTFADQAVIAIENVRLFKELEARTHDLTRSVDELTALGEVGRALSSTLDLETVLHTIAARANQLAGTDGCSVWEYDEASKEFMPRATDNMDEDVVAIVRQTRIRPGEGAQGRMVVTRQPVQIPDIAVEDAYRGRLREALIRAGTRSVLAVPLMQDDRLVGGLTVSRKTPGEFPPEVVQLLTTFATQSALAIQNARLFREIEDKSRQLEIASQHKSEFLANMSHELRTPLNAIIGFSEVLSERMFGELNEKQEEYLKDIYGSGTHLLSLINDILDLSKIEAGRMELELSDFHLPTALDSAMTLVRERAGRRSIALHTNIDDRLGQIQADERKVRQVVLNLLSNAIKFTPEGGRIEVGAVSKDGLVEVSVSDTGVGIAPEDQEAVFEEFRQVGTADKKVEGTGLGLTLCRKFVELHGGKIWVKSEIGAGSTFTFTIPVNHGE